MASRPFTLLGIALLAAFAAWLLVFTLALPSSRSAPWWGLALAASLVGLTLATLRPDWATWGIAMTLGGHALMRGYFGLSGEFAYADLLELALFAALAAGAFASALGREWAATAILAASCVVVLFIVRMIVNGNGEAALRQVVQLAGLMALWRAMP